MLCILNELRENYDKIKSIAEYILSQLRDDLVFSDSNSFGVYAATLGFFFALIILAVVVVQRKFIERRIY